MGCINLQIGDDYLGAPLPIFANPSAGVTGLSVLKTTQSGYEGFCLDKYTLLPETRERMLATTITSTWKYAALCSTASYQWRSLLLCCNLSFLVILKTYSCISLSVPAGTQGR